MCHPEARRYLPHSNLEVVHLQITCEHTMMSDKHQSLSVSTPQKRLGIQFLLYTFDYFFVFFFIYIYTCVYCIQLCVRSFLRVISMFVCKIAVSLFYITLPSFYIYVCFAK